MHENWFARFSKSPVATTTFTLLAIDFEFAWCVDISAKQPVYNGNVYSLPALELKFPG